jgi:hypothetical protein
MHAHKLLVTVPADHRIVVELPDDFPAGAAEVIVLSAPRAERKVVRLGGALGGAAEEAHVEADVIAEALDELREERRLRLEEETEEGE